MPMSMTLGHPWILLVSLWGMDAVCLLESNQQWWFKTVDTSNPVMSLTILVVYLGLIIYEHKLGMGQLTTGQPRLLVTSDALSWPLVIYRQILVLHVFFIYGSPSG